MSCLSLANINAESLMDLHLQLAVSTLQGFSPADAASFVCRYIFMHSSKILSLSSEIIKFILK